MQGLGLTEVAYQNAVAYAKERTQMRSLSGPKHPDPRMLLPVIDYGHLGLPGTDFNKIVVGTIMGPNLADKSSTHRAALMLMEGAGLANASNRIVICDTPYRSAI